MATKKKSVAFYERNSWYHRTKELAENGTVRYGKKGGFSTQEEAEESYYKYEEEFQAAQRKIQLSGKLEKASKSCASAGNKCREILNLVMKEAVTDGYIGVNPVTETKPYKRKKPNIVILSKEKLKIFLKAASKDNWYLEILLALFCGLRKGEILGLKFSDFDMEKHTVKINRQIVSNPIIKENCTIEEYQVIEREPKTQNSFRTLRMPDVILEELEKRKILIDINKSKLQEDYMDGDYVSCQVNGRTHSLSAMNIALKKICVRNSLLAISVHGLRHMFATILIEQGVSLAKISGLLGHSSVNTTFEYYCDVMDENEKIIAFMNDTFAV